MNVPADSRVQPLIIRQPFFTKWIIRLTFLLVGLALLAAALWSLYEVYNAKYFQGDKITVRTWVYAGLAALGILLGIWCLFSPWRRSALQWRADSGGIHISRGKRPLRKINWADVDSISSRKGFGHGGVVWMNGLKSKAKLPLVRRKKLVELIELWKRVS